MTRARLRPPRQLAIHRVRRLTLTRYQLEAQKAFQQPAQCGSSQRTQLVASWVQSHVEALVWPTLMAIAILAVAYAPVVEKDRRADR